MRLPACNFHHGPLPGVGAGSQRRRKDCEQTKKIRCGVDVVQAEG